MSLHSKTFMDQLKLTPHIANYVSTIAKRLGTTWKFVGNEYWLVWDAKPGNGREACLLLPEKVAPDRLPELEADLRRTIDAAQAYRGKWWR